MPSESKPDLTKIPDFEAALTYLRDKETGGINLRPLKTWIQKLDDWCRASWDDRERGLQEYGEKVGEMEVVVERLGERDDELATLREKLEDHARGIVDIEEVYDLCGLQGPWQTLTSTSPSQSPSPLPRSDGPTEESINF